METAARHRFLRARLISVVPNEIKNFMELLNDNSWSELVNIFENQSDYKDLSTSDFLKVEVNKFETPEKKNRDNRVSSNMGYTTNRSRFNGTCFYCVKPGHKKSECYRRDCTENNANRDRAFTNNQTNFQSSNRYDSRNTSSIRGQFEGRHQQKDRRRVKNFNIDADESDDDLEIDGSSKVNTLECENFYITGRKASLIRARSNLEIKDDFINTPMLIDCGATSSLINPEVIENYLEHGINQIL